ncbi:HBR487Cp [Eremothecium sinecaudum]|uniref:HBR487Cp n=1 Tax=Eremothecium sinecaudum TaxID=45286 RepID=A0A109UXQ4_9SACH|nr:HBR487Cp [Eremothecium sinecaudum]AMD19388.1 HBR487Cp [Eremothecium sinecaudum]
MSSFDCNENGEILNVKNGNEIISKDLHTWFKSLLEGDANCWKNDTADLVKTIAKENFEQLVLTFVLLLYIWVAKL